mmetsp:Transcript_12694/g.32886  ORF Transcript_12694/g.32886 Transcript_12694/m.32886 type:complete len:145 (-) Transcript_12694:984-1418(-)|eukprot:CAMPEP_0197489012 /NCGR_PEP_ID=MMETSP1311-20131121/3892_1 /TAXON_ID=464262 /ORGANISM="Genus nov. species nov., Strain RCC856" /LENGTH=144 /DNA_ID=CAMNT_0043033239 /DNA_START=220 /DNA_END=654 /DNA_ORIENTATION=+
MAEAVSGSGAVSAVISVDENRGGSTSATTVQRQVDQPSTSQPESVRLTLFPKKKPKKKLKWSEDTVDNENMGRKKSKKCCIFHKKKRFDESSSEEDSDSDEALHDEQCNDVNCPLPHLNRGNLWQTTGRAKDPETNTNPTSTTS